MYPLTLHMKGKKVVVVGGGKIAYFKIVPLVEEEAVITVISPQLDSKISKLVETGNVQWLEKEYESADIQDAFLIIAATDNAELNNRIDEEAGAHQLVNVITNPERGNVHFPAAVRRGKLLIAVSTGGASPKLAKRIRDEIAETYDEAYEEYLEFLYECRMKIKQLKYEKAVQNKLLQEILQDDYKQSPEKRVEFLSSLG